MKQLSFSLKWFWYYFNKVYYYHYYYYSYFSQTPQGCLGSEFFNTNSTVKPPTRYQGFIEVIQLYSLEPGEYVIVPFTYEPNITADFLLTVYTKADAKIR